jgi:hypothetical protein
MPSIIFQTNSPKTGARNCPLRKSPYSIGPGFRNQNQATTLIRPHSGLPLIGQTVSVADSGYGTVMISEAEKREKKEKPLQEKTARKRREDDDRSLTVDSHRKRSENKMVEKIGR